MSEQITEAQVCDWLIQRMMQIRESGLPVTSIDVNANSHTGENKTTWAMHAAGECVISEPTSEVAVEQLRKDVFGDAARKAEEKRRTAKYLLEEAAALEGLPKEQESPL